METSVFGVITPHPPIFVPAVGGRRALETGASLDALARAHAALARFDPDAVVLMSPHAPALSDAVAIDDAGALSGSLAQFGDDLVRAYKGDPALATSIAARAADAGLSCVMRSEDDRLRPGWLDHATIVPLSFLDPQARWPLVVISLSYLPYSAHRTLGQAVRDAARAAGRRVAFVASGDLSHRLTRDAAAGYSPHAADLDRAIIDCVESGELSALSSIDPALIEAGAECGLRSFITLGGFCGDDPVPTAVLSYEGPWGVGYLTALVGAAALECDVPTPDSGLKGGSAGEPESEIVALARDTIVNFVRNGTRPEVDALRGREYPDRAGAFVSLHRGGELRGCIGTILPTRPTLAAEVASNAIEAATRDPRFPPVDESELEDLDIKVDVLHAPETCTLDDLDPTDYGVVVTSGWRRGLLLPDLEGIEDVETQVAVAMRKAGIRPGETCEFERFRVDRYT